VTSKPKYLLMFVSQTLFNIYYQNRSCLRPHLLGYSTKTYQLTTQNCSKRACTSGKSRLRTQKQRKFGKKSSQSRLFMGVKSYEIKSDANKKV
jgi:hypothetical protein